MGINGAKIFKTKCSQCHNIDIDGKHGQGPNLHNIWGRLSGSSNDYSYSTSMKKMNIIWDENSLMNFLLAPKKYVKGTKMAFAGIKKEKERRALIEYMRNI